VNNALNYWYPLKGEASQAEHDARHVRLFQFRDRLQQQLGAARYDEVAAIWNTAIEAATQAVPGGNICDPQAVADAIRKLAKPRITAETFNLAMAMAELANVAAERDSFKAGREDLAAVLATYAAERDELKAYLTGCNQHGKWAGVECIGCIEAERDRLDTDLTTLNSKYDSLIVQYAKVSAERNTARQSLRAAEQDVAETESVNSDLRTVNARLVAERDAMQADNGILRTVNLSLTTDLRAATQRADTAEAILRAKA